MVVAELCEPGSEQNEDKRRPPAATNEVIFIGCSDRERTGQELEHSVFTQVCVAACQLLWNNIESRLKAKMYVQD